MCKNNNIVWGLNYGNLYSEICGYFVVFLMG